jgi:hypothetical protein
MNETQTYDFPTEVIDLPSKGLIYPKDHPLAAGQIEIKYMTAREEDILSSQNLIKKGIVLDKLFESIIVTPGVNPSDIFIGDKNAILLATRILGYGADYEVEVTDPFTLERQQTTIDLSQIQIKEVDDSILNRENRYTFETSATKNKIVFKLLTHGDEISINQEQQALERLNKGNKGLTATSDVTTRLRYMIISVDGKEDMGFVNKWVQNSFLARDVKDFRKYVASITPDLDLKFNFTSDITGETEALDIPFGVSFFYPSN